MTEVQAPEEPQSGRWLAALVVTVLVALITVGAVVIARKGSEGGSEPGPGLSVSRGGALTALPTTLPGDRTPADPAVIAGATTITDAELAQVGTGNAQHAIKAVHDAPLLDDGKPELLFIDAEFCPFCAAERWPLVVALSRFGTFANLSQVRSATVEGNIASFSFYKSSYSSPYLSFVPVVNEDREQRQLQTLTPSQQAIWTRDTGSPSYPFLDFGGRYAQLQAGFDDNDLSGLDWQQIATDLADPQTTVAKDILGEANSLITKLCALTGQQPASACRHTASTAPPSPGAGSTHRVPAWTTAMALVRVYNGTNITELAHHVAAEIAARGWTVPDVGSVQGISAETTVYYSPNAKAAAVHLEHEFPAIRRIRPEREAGISYRGLTLVLMTGWHD